MRCPAPLRPPAAPPLARARAWPPAPPLPPALPPAPLLQPPCQLSGPPRPAASVRPQPPLICRDATGEDDLGGVEEVEVIFTRLGPRGVRVSDTALGCLRRLTLIRNGMAELPCLGGACRRTLTRLCVVHQELASADGLDDMPALEELVLSENRIERFVGPAGCPALRRLWLDRNQLGRLEGLEALGNLRELHIEGNPGLRTLSGVVGLVNLRALYAAGTGVARLRDLEALVLLPALARVSFRDPHYEDAPVAAVEDYRRRAVHGLPQVTEIDGQRVEPRERREVQDAYLQSLMRFNDTVQQLRAQEAAHLQALSSQRRGLHTGAREAVAELGCKLDRVEAMVQEGRERVLQAYQALSDTQADMKCQMQLKIEGLVAEHSALVKRALERQAAESRALEEAHRLVQHFEDFRTREALRLLELPVLSEGARSAYEVVPGSPERDFVEKDFWRSERDRSAEGAGASTGAEFELVGVYRICDEGRASEFQQELQKLAAGRQREGGPRAVAGDTRAVAGGAGAASTSNVKLRWMYLAHNLDELHDHLVGGFKVEEPSFGRTPLVFASLPQQACGLAEAQVPGSPGLHVLLLCQVLQRSAGGAGSGGVMRLGEADSFLPHFYLQVASTSLLAELPGFSGAWRPSSFEELQENLVASLVGPTGPGFNAEEEGRLQILEAEVEAALDQYERSLWHTLDPQMAATSQRQESEMGRLREQLASVNAEIKEQQELQQYIIGEFRSNSDVAAEGPAETPRSRTALLEGLRGARIAAAAAVGFEDSF